MVAVALLLIVAAVALVRYGWAGRPAAAWAGWGGIAAALLLLALSDGAWGVAVGTTLAMMAALAIVLYAGWREPARARRAPRTPPSVTLPHGGAEFGRRAAVFALVVPVAFAATQWLAFALQALARSSGWNATDATVLMLLGQPLLWGVLMTWQMTRSGPAAMVAPPVLAALAGTLLWSLS
ncbi:hypothetical protein SAMN06297144_0744 [Sphingomonas guangdongensis]|uniref:Uncharacterized protein n=1 Tax=Sphingomonas guangdongensis TaxID=1141890 RepID=A0A285QIC0_9SPHN|nr:hypothetical protein [Sphingomonas guangdongensis]SOB79812.1 hypothetical protein SAMN06297144_0744 [Sphingomonas guangdongensis]